MIKHVVPLLHSIFVLSVFIHLPFIIGMVVMALRRLESALNDIKLLLRCLYAPFGLLLESVQDIDCLLEPDRVHRPIGIPFVS